MGTFSDAELAILRSTKLLKYLSDDDFAKFIDKSNRKIFSEGEYLTKEGEENDNFYIILSGSASLYKQCDNKNSNEPIGLLKSGESIGEMRIIKNRECSLTITPAEPLTVLQAPISELTENANLHEKLLESIVDIISCRLRETNDSVAKTLLEKRLKKKQLRLSFLGILILIAFLFELGLGMYYVVNANDYMCNGSDENPAQFPVLKN